MDQSPYFKSIVEQDVCAVVVCNVEGVIVYMNPAAVCRYEKRGGAALIGRSLMDCHDPHSAELIDRVVSWFAADAAHNRMFTYHNVKENKDVYMVALRDAEGVLRGYYEKHEYRTPETAQPYSPA